MPREQMTEIALRYPAGLRVGSFEKSDVPFAADAYRFENGVRMAGVGLHVPAAELREHAGAAAADARPRSKPSVVAVDEENGTVLLWMDFGKGTLPGPQGAGKALVTFEAFKIYGGEVHAVEAFFEGMAPGTPRGWAASCRPTSIRSRSRACRS